MASRGISAPLAGWIESALERSYRRLGERWVSVVIGVAVIFLTGIGLPFALSNAAHYLAMKTREFLIALALGELVAFVVFAWVIYATRETFRAVGAWSPTKREDKETATRALSASYELPARVTKASAWRLFALLLPVGTAVLTLPSGHKTLADFIVVAIAVSIAICTALAVVFYGAEVAMRPVRAELSRVVGGPKRAGSGTSLALRVVVGLLTMMILAGFIVGTFSIDRGSAPDGVAKVLLIALAAAVGFGSTIALVIAVTIVSPVRDLIEGTRAVSSGDLEKKVPVTSTDELGELAESFNEMVQGLKEREQLRGENVELVDELRASRARLVASGNEARRRVERDLHDGAQQNLVMLNLKLGVLKRKLEDDPEAAGALVDEAKGDLDRALAELRDLAHGIYPQVLTADGVRAALTEHAPDAHFEVSGLGRYSAEIEAAVYFCCLEALQNASKYAGDNASVQVKLSETDGELRFEVADDGTGFDPASVNGSAGLQNMADRIGALGGELRVESTQGEGTQVVGSIPVGS